MTDRDESEVSLDDAVAFGLQHHQAGRLAEAQHIYGKILEVDPNHVDAGHFLGVVAHQLGRTPEAIGRLETLLSQCPEHVDLHNNLGRIYKDAGRLDDARARFEFATKQDSTRPDLWNNLGTVQRALRDFAGAAQSYRQAISLDGSYADAYLNLGNLLQQRGQDDEAAGVYRQAVELSPDRSVLYQNLCQALYRAGRTEEAENTLRQWLQFQPDHPGALHLAGALGIADTPERASDDYISQHFDEHSESFDEHLRELEYRAPELIGTALDRFRARTEALADRVLDAGCGTGLCGPYLRKHTAFLEGVDLSAGMVTQARGRGQYDHLVVGELTAFLQETTDPYDVIACADTLCYFGPLLEVFRAAHHALLPGGWFLFTAESLDAPGFSDALRPPDATGPSGASLRSADSSDYELRFHGRYAPHRNGPHSLPCWRRSDLGISRT